MAGQWFSLGTLNSSTDRTYHHDIIEILLKVALNTITPYPSYDVAYLYLFAFQIIALFLLLINLLMT